MQRLAKEQKTTILMVTHDDRIVEMEDGYLASNAKGVAETVLL